jgi:hypothetical protein
MFSFQPNLMQQQYTMPMNKSGLPPTILSLFAPRPPIQYLPPIVKKGIFFLIMKSMDYMKDVHLI